MKPSGIAEAMVVILGVVLISIVLIGLTAAACFGWIDYNCKRFSEATFLWILAVIVGGIYVFLDGNERGIHRH